MKLSIAIFCSAFLLLLSAFAAKAQSDIYAQSTLVTLAAPQALNQTGATTLNVTNDAVDVHAFQGVVAITTMQVSNKADLASSLLTKIEGSNDKSTWTTLDSAALSTSGTIILTNIGSSVLLATNTYTVVSGSFATSTSNNATASGLKEYGYVAAALPTYIRVVYTLTGSNAVYGASSALRGRRYMPY